MLKAERIAEMSAFLSAYYAENRAYNLRIDCGDYEVHPDRPVRLLGVLGGPEHSRALATIIEEVNGEILTRQRGAEGFKGFQTPVKGPLGNNMRAEPLLAAVKRISSEIRSGEKVSLMFL